METKVKKFSKKLLALFLAVVMAVGCFTSVITAYGASSDPGYTDLDAEANFMNWAELTDEQTAGALLDWADAMLGSVNYHLVLDLSVAKIDGYIDSVDGILNVVKQASDIVESYGGLLGGDIQNIDLTAINNLPTDGNTTSGCGVGYRSQNTAKEIILTIAQILYQNSHDFSGGKNVIRQFINGEFDLGWILPTVLNAVIGSGDIYELLQDTLGMEDGYESNLVYNLIQSLVLNAFYKDSASSAYQEAKAKKLDTMMFDLMSGELLQKINVLVTYGESYVDDNGKTVVDNSAYRYEKIQQYMSTHSVNYATAAAACGYDPDLIYSSEPGYEDNILLFAYGSPDDEGHATASTEKIDFNETDNLFDFGMRALKLAWRTVLKDTLGLIHVNYSNDKGHGSNFDNLYYYWARLNLAGGWNENDLASMYTLDNLTAWANHEVIGDLTYDDEAGAWVDKLGNTYTDTTDKTTIRDDEEVNVYDENGRVVQQAPMTFYNDYGAKDATEFLGWVKETFEYDREATGEGSWKDIDATQLFGKLRYSPMVDYYFSTVDETMKTGPINLYFMQTGSSNLEDFFDDLIANNTYPSIVSGLNDALVAAVKDIFVSSANSNGNINNLENYPTLATTSSTDPSVIASTLVDNAAKVFQYTADAADANILKAFYDNGGEAITESNFEDAALPLLISCINEITMLDPIRDSEWDMCANVEGVAYIALKEYLSYVLPGNDYDDLVDVVEGKYVINFNTEDNSNPLLLMARDALGYVLQGSVPIIDENGNKVFDAYNADQYPDVTIWDVFNNIACYYAYDKGAAALLGLYDSNGNIAFNRSNTLWENIDLVVNKYFPVIGELQYGQEGQASSYSLIWEDIINGALNISNEKEGRGGIENFIYRLLTIVSAAPISETPIIQTVYDLVEKIVNGMFGARYNGQGFTRVVPSLEDLSSLGVDINRPFDAILQRNVFCYWTSTDATGGDGFLGSLICNIYEFLGGAGYDSSSAQQVDATWQGLMFIVKAVNNFIPSFVPQIGSHTLGTLQTSVTDASMNVANGGDYKSTLRVTNTSAGINRFYTDKNGQQQEQGRYYMEVKNIVTDVPAFTVDYTPGDLIAPNEIAVYNVTGLGQASPTTVTVTTTYDIYQSKVDRTMGTVTEKATLVASDLVTTTYIYTTPESDWFYTCYNAGPEGENDFTRRFTNWEPDVGGETTYTQATNNFGTSDFFGGPYIYVTYPKQIVIPNNNPGLVDQMGIRAKNSHRFTSYEFSGVYSYPDTAVQAYTVSGTNVSSTLSDISGTSYAYVAMDPETGDLLNYARVDISSDGGKTWDRGPQSTANGLTIYQGYDQSTLEGNYQIRTHVALTFDEACRAGIVNAVQRTEVAEGEYVYESVFINATQNRSLTAQLLANNENSISFSTPANGIYFCAGTVSVPNNKSTYVPWIAYDGMTELPADEYEMAVCFFHTQNEQTGKIDLIVADNDDLSTLESTYTEYNNLAASYQESDFTSPTAYSDLNGALKNALSAMSTVLNVDNALEFGSTYEREAKTVETTSIFGDLAYEPVASSETLPVSLAAYCYEQGGYYYWNEQCTQPIYKRVELTNIVGQTTEEIDGKQYTVGSDAAGVKVIKNPDDGKWYLRNDISYVYEWNFDYSTPYYGATTTQKTNDRGQKLYLQDQFAYRTATGVKTTSYDTISPWAYKIAELTDYIVANEPGKDYRGLYQRAIDELVYYGEVANNAVSAASLPVARENVSDVREGMNNVNYSILEYEQMVSAAKEVESMYSYDAYKNHYLASDVTYNEDGEPVPNEGAQPLFSCLDSDWDETWKSYLNNGGYEGVDIVSIEDRGETKYSTTSSAIAVQNAIENFQLYYDALQPRDYAEAGTGNQIAKEIVLSIGDSYDKFTVTQEPVYGVGENGETIVTTPAVISVADGANIIRGAVDENGNLANTGETVYTEDSWNMYVARLADAITSRQNATDAISATYTAKSEMKIAENELEEYVPVITGYSVTASLVIATDNKGTTSNSAVSGDYTITLYKQGTDEVVGEPYTFTSANGANSFTLTDVPAGTYDMVITSAFAMDRTVTVNVTDHDLTGPTIPMVVCNYNGDAVVSAADALAVYAEASAGTNDDRYNLNGDAVVSAADALLVYACAAGTIDMPAITIE